MYLPTRRLLRDDYLNSAGAAGFGFADSTIPREAARKLAVNRCLLPADHPHIDVSDDISAETTNLSKVAAVDTEPLMVRVDCKRERCREHVALCPYSTNRLQLVEEEVIP